MYLLLGRGSRGRSQSTGPSGRGNASQRGKKRCSSLPWQEVNPASDTAPTLLQFNETTGPNLDLPTNSQPIDFFTQLFDSVVLQHLVDETNR